MTNTLTPEQMQDGSEYTVTFCGKYVVLDNELVQGTGIVINDKIAFLPFDLAESIASPPSSPVSGEAVTLPRQVHSRHQWAQPGDEEHRTFILRFSDPDCGDQVFTGEGAEQRAHDAWNLYSPSWNVYLFGTVPLSAAIGEPQ